MMKKALQVAFGLLIISNCSFAQPWSGNDLDVDAYRNGNVGIGISSPQAKLHVNGNAIIGYDGGSWITINDVPGARYRIATGDYSLSFQKHNATTGAFETNFILHSSGNVGVGTVNPLSRLHLVGPNLGFNAGDKVNLLSTQNQCGNFNFAYVNIYSYRTDAGDSWITTSTRIENKIDADTKGFIEFNPKGFIGGLALGTNNTQHLYISESGNVGIGTTQFGTYKLTVEGKIAARGVKVTTGNFADYVFEPTYKLRPLAHLEQYINQNKHLPGIPSAEEVKKEGGVELGDMNVKLLEKVEELSLYIIEMNKKLEEQQKEIERMKKLIPNNKK